MRRSVQHMLIAKKGNDEDEINMCCTERRIYFICDPPVQHMLIAKKGNDEDEILCNL